MIYYFIGALTAKAYSFIARPWEIEQIISVDFFNSLLSPTIIEMFGMRVVRVLPVQTLLYIELSNWLSDKVRFSFDLFNNNRLTVPLMSELKGSFSSVNGFGCVYKIISWKTAFLFFHCYFNFSYSYVRRSMIEKAFSLAGGGSFNKKVISSLSLVYGLIGDVDDFFGVLSLKCFLTGLGCVFYAAQRCLNLFSEFPTNFLFFSDSIDCSYLLTLVDYLVLVGLDLRMELPLIYFFVRKRVAVGSMYLGIWFANRFLCRSVFYSSSCNISNSYLLGQSFSSFLNFLLGRSAKSKYFFSSKFPLVLFGDLLFVRGDFNLVDRLLRSLDKFMFFILGGRFGSIFYLCSTLFSVLSSFFLGFSSRVNDLMKCVDSIFLGALIFVTVNCNNMVIFKSLLTFYGFLLVVSIGSHFGEYFIFLKDVDLFLPINHCYERVACGFNLFGLWTFVGKFVYSLQGPVVASVSDSLFIFFNFLKISVSVPSFFDIWGSYLGLVLEKRDLSSLKLDCFVFFSRSFFLEKVSTLIFSSLVVTSGLSFKTKDDVFFCNSCYYLV